MPGTAETDAMKNVTRYQNFGLFSRLSWMSSRRTVFYGALGMVFPVYPRD